MVPSVVVWSTPLVVVLSKTKLSLFTFKLKFTKKVSFRRFKKKRFNLEDENIMLMSTLYSCVLIVTYVSYIGLKSEYKSQDLAWNLHSLLRPQYVCCCLLVSIFPTFFYETWIYFYLKVRDFCILHHFTHSLSYNTHSWIIE